MAQIEPMDIDSEFDNKENSLHHSNVLPRTPCTEKGYEELDVSELNMKLRYSITPASSPMSKSLTVNSLDNRTFDSEDYINNVIVNENCNLTRSLNSTITRNDMPKSLPLQVLSTEPVIENKNKSVFRSLDKTTEVHDNDATITLSGQNYLDDNMSLPSTSSSIVQTPEATTPTKEIPKHDGGSPIMRGLKSVLNMFRSSQSPIPPADVNVTPRQEILSLKEPVLFEEISKSHLGMASTPISNKQRENSSPQRNSPLKESIVFNDDLERELQWKEETTILFKEEKIPIHKLLLPQSLSSIAKTGETPPASSNVEKENFNSTVEQMDISYSESFSAVKTGRHIQSADITYTNDPVMAESDGEFVDCETTINNDDISDNKVMESLTSSINSQNNYFQHSHNPLQIHTEKPIANNKSEINLQTKCDKNVISTAYREDCNNHEIFLDSVIKSHNMKSNMIGVLVAENQNELGSEIILENDSENRLKQLSETEHTSMGTILGENLSECLADSKHPSDIPLPDEDDTENVSNFNSVTMTTKQQELKFKADPQLDMSIDHNETSVMDKNCSSENKGTKKLDFDCIVYNETTVKEIDQEKNNQEIENTQCINTKENIQIIESNDNLSIQIENAPLEEINNININSIIDNGELNLETSSKIMMHSLEPNNGMHTEPVFDQDKTKCDLNINQSENNKLVEDNQSAIMEYLNEVVGNKNTNLQIMENLKQEHENTYVFEEKNSEKITNNLGSNNTFCSIDNDVKLCSSNQIESSFENNQACILTTEDTTTAPENIATESSSLFMQHENKNFEININIPLKVQESQDAETILQSQCSFKHFELNADVLKDNTISDVEKTCNMMENVEIITVCKEIFDINSTNKLDYLTKEREEGKETLPKGDIDKKEENFIKEETKESLSEEVINTTEAHCTSKTIESEIDYKQNVNELCMQISQTNETFNMSLGYEDQFRTNEMINKTDVIDHDPNTSLINSNDKENEIIENGNLNNVILNETVCNTEVVDHVISYVSTNATFNMSIVQEDEIENKETKEKAFGNESVTVCSSVPDEQIIPSVTLTTSNYRLCQKEENEGSAYECEHKINAVNINQENKILDSNNHNSPVSETRESNLNEQNLISSNLKIDDHIISYVDSNTTFNMSIDKEDIIESKEIEVKTGEYDFERNVLNICPQEKEIFKKNNRISIAVNETEEGTLNSQKENINNIKIDQINSDKISNVTFSKGIDQEDISESKDIKGSEDQCDFKTNVLNIFQQKNEILNSKDCDAVFVNETGEGTINTQKENFSNLNIDQINSKKTSNVTLNMGIDQEGISEYKEIKGSTDQCDLKSNILNICQQENEKLNTNSLDVGVVNEIGEGTLNSQKKYDSNLNINQLNYDKSSNATFNMGIDQEDISESKEIKGSTDQCDLKSNVLNICQQENEILNTNNLDVGVVNEIGEGTLNSQKKYDNNLNIDQLNYNKSSNATFNMGIDQEDISESKEIKGSTDHCDLKSNILNICQQENEILNTNNLDVGVVNEIGEGTLNSQKKYDSNLNIDQLNYNKSSNATFNMGIDQEDISESKEIKGSTDQCDFKTNELNICKKENEILNTNNRDSVVANETGGGTLNPLEGNVSNSNIDLINSNETFKMDTCMEDMNEIKEKTDECKPEADETGECALKKQNVTVSHSILNDCAIFNATLIADDKKEEKLFLNQMNQMHTKSEENTEPVFLPKRSSSRFENESLKADAIDGKLFLDNTDCEIKNDQITKVAKLMDTSLRTSKVLFQNESDKVESESLNEKSVNNIELDDCLTMEIKDQEAPPLSPVISSKGYNFNFDEIDDPFATKTRIRSSPPPEDYTGSNEKGITKAKSANITKKDFQRRKSVPVKRQIKSVKEKNKINSTFSEAVDFTITTKEIKTEMAIANTTCTPEENFVKTTELPPCQTEETHNDIDRVTNNENVHIHEAEVTSNLSNSTILEINKREAKNVFNLPEMSTDMNFRPLVTKSKVCRTPSPKLEPCSPTFKVPSNYNEPSSQSVNPEDNISDVAKINIGNKADHDASVASSSSKGTEDATVREVNTEDEDTVEGPFFEADELNDDDKVSDIVADSDDMMNFNDMIPQGTDDNDDNGEMFIDAEAFEFLLNQNKSNMVVDSGKESLFLKFDPLFAKRMSSDGVLAALNKVQKRQSTPKRASKAPTIDLSYCDKTSTGTLNINATTEVNSTPENTFEDPNTLVSKPMMVVNPAVNSIISPRNKPVSTPPRVNRRSLTFTSPAIAVIDRLLSLSGNNSMLNNESPTRQVRMGPNETDLTQLRELLAEKEIHVNNLRIESKELKERLSTLETHVKSLESESEQRLRKVNELNERLVEKTNINRNMAAVVEEYERTIASLIAETEQDKKRHAEERVQLVKERDEQTAHLASMEYSFNDLHSKYEKSKQIILACKANEDTYKKSIKEFEESLLKMQNNYELLKQHATSKLNQANQELERLNKAHNAEVVKLNAMIKRKDLHITSLEDTLAQKTKANEELTAICDELINKVG